MNWGESIVSIDNQLLRNQYYLIAIGQSLLYTTIFMTRGEAQYQ